MLATTVNAFDKLNVSKTKKREQITNLRPFKSASKGRYLKRKLHALSLSKVRHHHLDKVLRPMCVDEEL